MTTSAKTALWIIALGVVVAGLWWAREWMTQFAVALILFLGIDGLRTGIARRAPVLPRWAALAIALALVLTLVAVVGALVLRNVGAIAARLTEQGPRLNALVAQVYALLHMPGAAPTLDSVLANANAGALLRSVGEGLQGLVGGVIFILIYLAFLFSAAAGFPEKLDRIFPQATDRANARLVLTELRRKVDAYLWVQTLMSLLITGLTFATLSLLGMPDAAFWSFLIFFLNYIPTIGSLMAVALTTLGAVVAFDNVAQVALVAGGVAFWQFVVGNFIQPRLTGESLNLSAVVVLLGLAFWGSLWGVIGAFLSAPLMTMLMLGCAQHPSTHWIAILLSEDGRPKVLRNGG